MSKEKKTGGRSKNSILRMTFTLLLVTALCALALAAVNENTKDVIAAYKAEKLNASMKMVMPEADSFEQVEYEDDLVAAAYKALSDGQVIGFCLTSEPSGFGGKMTLMVGVDTEDQIIGVSVVSSSETPNIGTKAETPEFLAQYEGKTAGIVLGKDGVDAISGATVTSKAVTKGVNAALAAAALLLKEVA